MEAEVLCTIIVSPYDVMESKMAAHRNLKAKLVTIKYNFRTLKWFLHFLIPTIQRQLVVRVDASFNF